MVRSAVFALALSLLAAPALADDLLEEAADEVQVGAGLESNTMRELDAAYGEAGAAKVVDELVDRGACAAAAQLGRTLTGRPGAAEATERADACLGEQVRFSLDDLDQAAGGDEYGFDPAGDLGSRGSGYGGGGEASSGPVYGGRADRRNREGERQRTYKEPARASTGVGQYAPSDSTATRRSATISTGADVAWSSLSFRVWFDFDSAALRPEALDTLATLAQHMAEVEPGTVLEIVGHTDSTGSYWYNQDLSERRAESVYQALRLAGVPSTDLGTRGMGETAPAYSNYSESGRSANRRVEFRFYRPMASRPITR